jgi:hypothetical protein
MSAFASNNTFRSQYGRGLLPRFTSEALVSLGLIWSHDG